MKTKFQRDASPILAFEPAERLKCGVFSAAFALHATLVHGQKAPVNRRTPNASRSLQVKSALKRPQHSAWNFAKVRILFAALLGVTALFMNGCRTSQSITASAETSIRALLAQQERDWNAGNLAGFMEGYAKSDATRFASGGNVVLGWQTVFDRYRKRYADPAAMGTTTFSNLDIKLLSSNTSMAVGRWHQKGVNGEGLGVFTLVLRKTPSGWRIIHDHTSTAETK